MSSSEPWQGAAEGCSGLRLPAEGRLGLGSGRIESGFAGGVYAERG